MTDTKKDMKLPIELFGIECGPGWKQLYEPLIERCQAEGVHIHQIKEKYGELRFYVGAASSELLDAIDAAEEASRTMCERCGEPGKLRDGNWLKTLCDSCVKP